MKTYNENMLVKGWFIGNFVPTCISTDVCEVAVKRYKQTDYESSHHHKVATEITFIVEGSVSMNNVIYDKGSIIEISPGESTDFLALTDTITVVVKLPSVKNDKYNEDI